MPVSVPDGTAALVTALMGALRGEITVIGQKIVSTVEYDRDDGENREHFCALRLTKSFSAVRVATYNNDRGSATTTGVQTFNCDACCITVPLAVLKRSIRY